MSDLPEVGKPFRRRDGRLVVPYRIGPNKWTQKTIPKKSGGARRLTPFDSFSTGLGIKQRRAASRRRSGRRKGRG